jgi:hypothetical protein
MILILFLILIFSTNIFQVEYKEWFKHPKKFQDHILVVLNLACRHGVEAAQIGRLSPGRMSAQQKRIRSALKGMHTVMKNSDIRTNVQLIVTEDAPELVIPNFDYDIVKNSITFESTSYLAKQMITRLPNNILNNSILKIIHVGVFTEEIMAISEFLNDDTFNVKAAYKQLRRLSENGDINFCHESAREWGVIELDENIMIYIGGLFRPRMMKYLNRGFSFPQFIIISSDRLDDGTYLDIQIRRAP